MNNGLVGINTKKPLSGLKQFFYSLRNFLGVNATIPVFFLTPETTETNVDVAVVPRGTGSFCLSVPDGLVLGGNKRGTRAIDLQLSGARAAATQVASGTEAFVVGSSNTGSGAQAVAMGATNTASGAQSVALGSANTANNTNAIALGVSNTASGTQSVALGTTNTASGLASLATGANGTASGAYSFTFARFGLTNGRSSSYAFGTEGSAAAGRQQGIGIGLVMTTTGATPTRATANNAAASATNQLTLQNNSTVYVLGHVLARDTVTNDVAYWEVKAVAKRGAAAANTSIVGTPSISKLFSDANAAAWVISVVADTTNGALAIDVTGAGTNAIRWHAQLDGNEVA